ncbi:MAG: NAD-dependent epimerase/dehydratase family protein [Bacteroidales bacterium]|nr:NAD-dependent epimerase/dehydratase family protein [Bacteroidales bacterium]MDD2612698.1 NAD-dependent epimerase/dehydratase family protein [Bacteroidales bacterium]MDD3906918.1 NAD-dependent epimerase/dehydratase family protein [Bacteroidales bacterium]MDD4713403.1 NAD-dependent epimerase/dehydratase family protein [Bacteroidales bacterium]
MKTAVVFGGSGLVGMALIHELIADENYEKVTVVLRDYIPISDPKLEQLILIDFRHLLHLQGELNATDYFCCIGTTIKKAGSQEAFVQVDFEIPTSIAQMAKEHSIPNLVVISSLGANAASSNFYLRTKGKMEESVRKIYSGNLKFIRPSLLIGKRKELRWGESMGMFFILLFGWLLIGPLRKYRGVYAIDVAKAMIKLTKYPPEKVVFESKELKEILQGY